VRLQKYLLDQELLSKKDLKALEADIHAEIEHAWQEAQEQMASMGDPLDIFDHVYAELPASLAEQRQAFQQFLARPKDTKHARTDHDSSAQPGAQTGNGQRR
jgi:hypothetical protein